ncbi:unnamed protein product [Blepharisma stoltei]|uniref:KIF-binding protein n=1 Tax=Blepharisma stoltei TaxID=1481888 RepID=A0AAU9JQE6_9CILI|nr:unnamed protein product [Blepharisma stoltei]
MDFFYSVFQRELEFVDKLMGMASESSHPYEHKYKAREILNSLLQEERVKKSDEIARTAEAIIEYMLGVNHFETEEITESDKHYQKSLDLFSTISFQEQGRFINIFQDLLNSLGVLCCNRGENEKGLSYFIKSQELYLITKIFNTQTFSHNFHDFLTGTSGFHFIIDGGVNRCKIEQNYTLTLFYMAQEFAKLGEKEKSAMYCAETMKRQIESGDYDIKDWAINSINLAEYYVENGYLNQALYTLQCGMSIILQNKRKLKSTIHMQIGRCFLAFLEMGATLHKDKLSIPDRIYSQCVAFRGLRVQFPRISPAGNLEEAKELFKLANTSLKQALEYFIIDGYVTEHIEMKRNISSLYKYLCYFDENEGRVIAMLQRRIEILEEYTKDLNRQAYSQLWQHLMNEISSVYLDIYDIKSSQLRGKNKKNQEIYTKTNISALTSIEKQVELLEFVQKFELNDESAKDVIQSSLNLMFGIARTYTKLDHPEIEIKISYMESCYRWYERIQNYLTEVSEGKYGEEIKDIEEQMNICKEMCELMPIRISQISAELNSI